MDKTKIKCKGKLKEIHIMNFSFEYGVLKNVSMTKLIRIKDREVGDKIIVSWPMGEKTEETIVAIKKTYSNGKFRGWMYLLDPKPHGSNWCMESWVKN